MMVLLYAVVMDSVTQQTPQVVFVFVIQTTKVLTAICLDVTEN